MALLLRSPFGRTLLAIRENERRARFLGIPSSGISGCRSRSPASSPRWPARCMRCSTISPTPRRCITSLSGEIVIMVVMGGMRAFWGPLVGAAMFVVLQDYISSMTVNWMSFVGLIFVLVVMFFPRGLLGMLQTEGCGMSHAGSPRRHEEVRQPGRGRRRLAERRDGRIARHHRPERRRQDHVLQHDTGFFPPTPGDIVLDGEDITRLPRRARVARAWRAPSRSPRSSPN